MPLPLPLTVGLLLVASEAPANLCDSLFVPEGYALTCETRIEAGEREERVVVRPSDSRFSVAELSIRPLKPGEAPLAWSKPEEWLADQIAVDVSAVSGTLRDLSVGGPLAHPVAKASVEGLITMLAGWSRLPLEACSPAENNARPHELKCTFGIEPVALDLNLRLVEAGDHRYAINYWAADEQRLAHLEAIANSFKPPG
jgi:hypothetical protein